MEINDKPASHRQKSVFVSTITVLPESRHEGGTNVALLSRFSSLVDVTLGSHFSLL